MRISKFAEPRGIVYPSAIAKMLLSKEVVEHIVDKFKNKKKENWEERPARDLKCKKTETLRVITETPEDSQRRCIHVENWMDLKSYGIEGPFLIKNNIVFYNSNEQLLLAIMCPPFVNIPDEVTDVWVRRVIPFTYGNVEFEIPEIAGTINMERFYDKAIYSTVFGKDRGRVIKLHRFYGTFQWEVTPIEATNTSYEEIKPCNQSNRCITQ